MANFYNNSIYGLELTGGTLFSGATPLSSIIVTNAQNIGSGESMFTGKTSGVLAFKTFIGSGGTQVINNGTSLIFYSNASSGGGGSSVYNGINTFTGGTFSAQTVNVTAVTLNNITVSGSAIFNSLTATTFYSGNTPLENYFITPYSNVFITGDSGSNSIKANNGTLASNGNFTFVTGWKNTADTESHYSLMMGGFNNLILGANTHSNILGGFYNVISGGSTGSIIIGGRNNSSHGNYSAIIGGILNVISNYSKTSAIVAGISNTITNFSYYSGIIAGRNNTLNTFAYTSTIVAGDHNSILNYSFNSGIIGGIYNSIITSNSSSIVGGWLNSISGISSYSAIVGGFTNVIDSTSNFSAIIGGQINKITNNASNSVIIGGNNITATTSNMVYVPNLNINNILFTANTNNSLLNINNQGNVYKTQLSAGTGIQISTQTSAITISYTGTSSGGGATINNGINTFTAGTNTFQSVNITGGTFDNITVTGYSIFAGLTATTASTVFLKVNTQSASTTNPERVIIYDIQPSSYSNVLVGYASASTYGQLNIRNIHNGNQASSDIVATADNGNETINYVDLGINSSTFNGFLGLANDGYVYSTGNDFWIGNASSGKSIKLFTDGTTSGAVRVLITSAVTNFNNTVSASTIVLSGSPLNPVAAGAKLFIFNNFI